MCECLEDLFQNVTNQIKLDDSLESSQQIISNYCGNDWKKYITKPEVCYNKTLVMRNEVAELYVITWSPNSESKIHDHPQIGCVMKVVQGNLREDIYIRKDQTSAKFDKTNYLVSNSVGFKTGNDILHKITNINNDNDNDRCTISIHIYSKPEYIQNRYVEIL